MFESLRRGFAQKGKAVSVRLGHVNVQPGAFTLLLVVDLRATHESNFMQTQPRIQESPYQRRVAPGVRRRATRSQQLHDLFIANQSANVDHGLGRVHGAGQVRMHEAFVFHPVEEGTQIADVQVDRAVTPGTVETESGLCA